MRNIGGSAGGGAWVSVELEVGAGGGVDLAIAIVIPAPSMIVVRPKNKPIFLFVFIIEIRSILIALTTFVGNVSNCRVLCNHLPAFVDPRGVEPRPVPCHGTVLPLYYGPFVYL